VIKFKNIICFVIALSVLLSCGRITDEKMLWQFESLPVVFSVIAPSQSIQVNLGKTIVRGEKIDTVYYPDSKVFVCGEDRNWIELTRKSYEEAIYTDANSEIVVQAGKTYYLRVDLPDKTLTAQTTVPLQKGSINNAEFIMEVMPTDDYHYFKGKLSAQLKLYENQPCILMALSHIIETNSTFLQQENVTVPVHIPDSISSFDLKLITFDPYLARYYASQEIMSQNTFSEGDLSAFTGTFNGLLPPYSNIVNGVGLFGSYVVSLKTINIPQP